METPRFTAVFCNVVSIETVSSKVGTGLDDITHHEVILHKINNLQVLRTAIESSRTLCQHC